MCLLLLLPAEIFEDKLGCLRLPRPGFAGDDQALVDPVALEIPVGGLRQREHVRLQRPDLLAVVLEHGVVAVVVGQVLVRVHCHKDGTGVSLKSYNFKVEFHKLGKSNLESLRCFFSVSICTCRHFIVSSKVNLASNFNASSYTYINSVCCVSLLEVLVDDVLVYVADGDHVGHPRVRGPVDHGAVPA